MPMIVRIVPITTGGKHFAGLLNTGANRKVAMPAVITAPYTASRPAVPPPAPVPMAIMGETAVEVTPWTRGSRAPTFQTPSAWTIEAMPQVSRSALMRWTSSSRERPRALPSRTGTMTAAA